MSRLLWLIETAMSTQPRRAPKGIVVPAVQGDAAISRGIAAGLDSMEGAAQPAAKLPALRLKDLQNLDIEAVAKAVEQDAGHKVPGLRQALAEVKTGKGTRHTPEQIATYARKRHSP